MGIALSAGHVEGSWRRSGELAPQGRSRPEQSVVQRPSVGEGLSQLLIPNGAKRGACGTPELE